MQNSVFRLTEPVSIMGSWDTTHGQDFEGVLDPAEMQLGCVPLLLCLSCRMRNRVLFCLFLSLNLPFLLSLGPSSCCKTDWSLHRHARMPEGVDKRFPHYMRSPVVVDQSAFSMHACIGRRCRLACFHEPLRHFCEFDRYRIVGSERGTGKRQCVSRGYTGNVWLRKKEGGRAIGKAVTICESAH